MKRNEKETLVSALRGHIVSSNGLFVVVNNGLTVAEVQELRRALRDSAPLFRVAKNRLMRLALKSTSFEAISDFLHRPTAVVFATDPLAATKVLAKFTATHPKLEIVGGSMGQDIIDAAGVMNLSKLPSQLEIRAKIARILVEPGARIARVLSAYGKAA